MKVNIENEVLKGLVFELQKLLKNKMQVTREQIEQNVFFYQNNAFLQLIFYTKTSKNVPMM
jgi:hypothetical protein